MHASATSPTKHDATSFTPPTTAQYEATVDETNVVCIDAWESGLCGCFGSCTNCCMVWCLPCVSLAQISQRIGFAKYWHVLLALVGLYLVELMLSRFVFARSFYSHWYEYADYIFRLNNKSDAPHLSSLIGRHVTLSGDAAIYTYMAGGVVLVGLLSCTFLGSLVGLALSCVTWALRSRVRSYFNIPGSCCGDCFVSFCCSCCAVAQMATQVKTYKKGNCDFGPVDTLPAFLPQ